MNFSKFSSVFCVFILLFSTVNIRSETLYTENKITEINLRGLQLIEKGLVYSRIDSAIGLPLSPVTVANDIKRLFRLGYFKDIKVEQEQTEENKITLTFIFAEKPRITKIVITGNTYLDNASLREKMLVFPNNMLNLSKIKRDVKIILDEYRKDGYLKTKVDYRIDKLTPSKVQLNFFIHEDTRVYLTKINVTGTNYFYPLDIERLMQSSEIDCFAWANESGIFQESRVNQDLQIITQSYLQQGFIKVQIDKPRVVLIQNPDYSEIVVNLNIHEGEQYYTGKIDIVSADGEKLLFDKDELLLELELQSDDVYNPFKQNRDRFKIRDIYLEQGYAKSRIQARTQIHEEQKIVDVTYQITRGEKAYINRIEIQGNYETLDSVVRRELDIHDNELYNGVKIRESQRKISRLGFFKPGSGVRFKQSEDEEENMLDYHVLLEEAQTGSFNGSLSYSGHVGFTLVLQVSKKNIFGTGKTVSVSAERQQKGDTRYDFSIITPYWFGTRFTNSFGIFSKKAAQKEYDVQTNGFNFGLSYPIWKNWNTSSRYSYKLESYSDISTIGDELLDGKTSSTLKSLQLGVSYSTVDHPMFPSEGYEATLTTEQFGGPLGGSQDYRSYGFSTRWFSSLNENKTIIFMAKFRHNRLEQTNPDMEIPSHKRFTIGGITTVRGFDWYDIAGPTSTSENQSNYLRKKWPYYGDGCEDNSKTTADIPCDGLEKTKSADRLYVEQHRGGIIQNIFNLELLYPLTREGRNIRGVIFYDAGNVWAEKKVYTLTENKRDFAYLRKSVGTGIRLITPMGVLRFEYGIKLDKKRGESASKFDFHISGLF